MNSQSGKLTIKSGQESPDLNSMFKNSKMTEIMNRPSSIDPLGNIATRSSYMRFFKENHPEDYDRVKEDLMKAKRELNKKNAELNTLKIDFSRLEKDNNKNLQVIETVLNEFGKDIAENILTILNNSPKNSGNTNENLNDQLNLYFENINNNVEYPISDESLKKNNKLEELNIKEINDQPITTPNNKNIKLSLKSFIRLREIFVINSLKKQIIALKNLLKKKDEEIESYKANIKCAKYSKLEYNYNNNLNNFVKTKKDVENMKKIISDTSDRFVREREENEKLFCSLGKYRAQIDDLKVKLKSLEEENKELISKNKSFEEKINFLSKYSNATSFDFKASLKQKESMLSTLKSDFQTSTDKFKTEKLRLEKRIYFMDKDTKRMREIIEEKKEEIKDLEKKSICLKEEGKKFISNLQWMLKIEKELFITEKKQLNEYIESLKFLLETIGKENNISIKIPEFKLILPTGTCLQEINQNKLLKESQRKYEETEKNLDNSLNKPDKNVASSNIYSEHAKLESLIISDLNINKRTSNDIHSNNNHVDNFKIEPIKGKESTFLLTALNRNKYFEEKNNSRIEINEREINNHPNVVHNSDNSHTENNVMDHNNISINSSKHRLKNLEKGKLNKISIRTEDLKKNDEHIEISNNMKTANHLKVVVQDKLLNIENKKEINFRAYNNIDDKFNNVHKEFPNDHHNMNQDITKNMDYDNDHQIILDKNNKIETNEKIHQMNKNFNDLHIRDNSIIMHKKSSGEEEKEEAEEETEDKAFNKDSAKEEIKPNEVNNKVKSDMEESNYFKHHDEKDLIKNKNKIREEEMLDNDQLNKSETFEKMDTNQHHKGTKEILFTEEENELHLINKDEDDNGENQEMSRISKKSGNSKGPPKKKRSSCNKLGMNYVIKILESDEQCLDIFQPYYQVNIDADNKKLVRKNTKSKSQIFQPENFSKMGSIERIFTEGIRKNSDFEELLQNPKIKNLYDL